MAGNTALLYPTRSPESWGWNMLTLWPHQTSKLSEIYGGQQMLSINSFTSHSACLVPNEPSPRWWILWWVCWEHAWGIMIVIYIYHMLAMSEFKREAMQHLEVLIFLLEALGFTVNKEKCILCPSKGTEVSHHRAFNSGYLLRRWSRSTINRDSFNGRNSYRSISFPS